MCLFPCVYKRCMWCQSYYAKQVQVREIFLIKWGWAVFSTGEYESLFVYLLALLREEDSQIYCLVDSAVWQSMDLPSILLMYRQPESRQQCVLCILLQVKEIWWNVWRNVGNWRKQNNKYRSKPRRGTPQSWKCHSVLTQGPQESWCGVNAIWDPRLPELCPTVKLVKVHAQLQVEYFPPSMDIFQCLESFFLCCPKGCGSH